MVRRAVGAETALRAYGKPEVSRMGEGRQSMELASSLAQGRVTAAIRPS